MSRTRQYPVEKPHPDSARIAGISAAIALNAALLMLLLRPIALPPAGTEPDPVQPFHWIDLVKPKPVDIVPVAKPHPVVPTHAATIPQRQPPVITRQSNAMSTKADTQSIDIKPDPLPPQIIGPPANPTPIEASLAYRDASPPPYPRDALREGIEGIVQLRVLVDETGHVLDVQIERSSGDHQLDSAAREQVLHRWLFQPAMRDGVPMRAWGRVPIVFRLDGR